jgi:IS30 family transposase
MKKPYKQLTLKQRYQIQNLSEANFSNSYIADKVKCNKSTIGREINRNKNSIYCAEEAHKLASKRRKTAAKASKFTQRAMDLILALMIKDLSPAAIAGRCELEGFDIVSHETIYRWIYNDKKRKGEAYKYLLRSYRGFRKTRKTQDGRGLLADRVSIDQRGQSANDRSQKGHWEGDTVHGKKGSLVTLVDRKTRFLAVRKSETRTKNEVTKKINSMLKLHKSKTLTVDNGREFYGHQEVKRISNVKVFFADPYSSWQRGSNENANGLLRRYYPKGCDFSTVTAQHLRRTVEKINLMPRKLLNWKSAYEVHYGVSVALIT